MNDAVEPRIIRGDARNLPLPDESVDLIVTSPPYFGLRDYGTAEQIGAEPTPQEFIAALIECTREMVRVLKPSGSIFVNLGDKYNSAASNQQSGAVLTQGVPGVSGGRATARTDAQMSGKVTGGRGGTVRGIGQKSLMLLPERYRIACVDELGLIARAVLVWSKPNGLPESVTDRVRRSHEDWVHLTRQPRYFAAVDEIREPHAPDSLRASKVGATSMRGRNASLDGGATPQSERNPLGKLPGSVWEIATQPLRVPAELGIDHFAAFPMEWPRRLILGWSPREVCTACGEGRRPVTTETGRVVSSFVAAELGGTAANRYGAEAGRGDGGTERVRAANGHNLPKRERVLTGYACSCPDTTAASTPGVVLDPFSGTGTTALVASMLGRQGIGVDLSQDYCRLAEWRVNDPKQRERASRPAGSKPAKVLPAPAKPVEVEQVPDLFTVDPAA